MKLLITSPKSKLRKDLDALYQRKTVLQDLIRDLERYTQLESRGELMSMILKGSIVKN